MLSANAFNFDWSRIFSFGKDLTLSLTQMTKQEVFMDSVDQGQTAENVISDLHCTHFNSTLLLNRFFILEK